MIFVARKLHLPKKADQIKVKLRKDFRGQSAKGEKKRCDSIWPDVPKRSFSGWLFNLACQITTIFLH